MTQADDNKSNAIDITDPAQIPAIIKEMWVKYPNAAEIKTWLSEDQKTLFVVALNEADLNA